MKRIAFLALGLVATLGCGARPPNIVLVSIDTLRADKLGAYGFAGPTSPVLDRRLAAEGVTFTRVFSQSPKTTPSHMTLLTSLYPCVHGVEMWETGEQPLALRDSIETLAELLHAAGYATVAFTGGGNVHAARGFAQGFDTYEHGQPFEKSVDWLRAHGREQKFFLFFHTYIVHDPYVHPLRFVRKFDSGYNGRLLGVVQKLNNTQGRWPMLARRFWSAVDHNDAPTVRFVEHLYEAGILRMDETNLAPLLALLDELGLARDTLLVFTSDHGEAFLEHGHFRHMDLYGETLHVPLVLRYPGRLPAGRRIDTPVTLLDVMPTILDLADVAVPGAAQGRSLVPLWSGGTLEPRPIVSEWNGRTDGAPFEAVRDGGFTYIRQGSSELLFEIARDPGEHRSVAGEAPEVLAARRSQLAAWEKECRARAAALGPRPAGEAPSEETRRQLRALGYVE
ncbi:MAG: sulfatase [Acidobacteria bacterium]|nr:sulfatase [Acidobacteriota bacterium]